MLFETDPIAGAVRDRADRVGADSVVWVDEGSEALDTLLEATISSSSAGVTALSRSFCIRSRSRLTARFVRTSRNLCAETSAGPDSTVEVGDSRVEFDARDSCELLDKVLPVESEVPDREDPNHVRLLSPAPSPAEPSFNDRASRQDDKPKLDSVDVESVRFGMVASNCARVKEGARWSSPSLPARPLLRAAVAPSFADVVASTRSCPTTMGMGSPVRSSSTPSAIPSAAGGSSGSEVGSRLRSLRSASAQIPPREKNGRELKKEMSSM